MDPVGKDIKEAICEAEKFFSITLAKEKLSPAAEIERTLLADKFRKLKTQLGLQNELPSGGKAPPRPPKGAVPMPAPVPVANDDQGGDELYDDVAAVIAQDDQYYEMSQDAEGKEVPSSTATDTGGENYEVMSAEQESKAQGGETAGEDYMAMEDDLHQEDYVEPQAENTADEDYEVPEQSVKPPAPAEQEENYEIPGADENYEDTDPSGPKDTDVEMYEGIEPPESVDGTVNWNQLKQSTSPENIQGVIIGGILNKRRKEGKVYLGSKFQKRYCVVRNHAMYYFKDKKANKQQGHILLPGYKVQLDSKKGREFHLTHSGGQRTYQFEANNKEEAEKWMKAIQRACDAPLSDHQRAELEELRNRQTSGDNDSLHYVPVEAGQTKNESVEEEEELYDDTQEDLYEAVETVQSSVSNQPSPGPTQELVDYEVSPSAVPSKQAPLPPSPGEVKTVEPIQEEEYELPETSAPPPRPIKTEPMPPIPSGDNPPEVPPPRPSKGQLPIPPVSPAPPAPPAPQQDDMYEVAGPDAPNDTSDLPPPPPPVLEEENYEVPDNEAPAPPPMRPPKRPQPQTPKPQAIPLVESPAEKVPERPSKPVAKQPPPAPKRKVEPPASPAEVQTIEINYANIYQALWTCDADDKDELAFRRGDLIYIYEKPHNDWWIGSLFKPQGYSVGLVPKKYVMEAYEMTA
ncbi:titin-like [Stylophora pistillata]|uniref:Src kinase-associated phosphoprotein 2 n=1 Tax=Stylophora pistillata TaxID=50429 RepID=A0A2B4SM77_STYPI|nr:titin-like [Stylophora pistillata]PFX29515.1 Src kinase-associated phosphoprotein 2 [Stylophora pistillata]